MKNNLPSADRSTAPTPFSEADTGTAIGGGLFHSSGMNYNKDYSVDSIRVIHKQVGEHGYLFLHFDYAFVESNYDAASGK